MTEKGANPSFDAAPADGGSGESAASAVREGGSLGRYQLVKRIATGGMAEVWLARATGARGFEKMVVIKTILPHLADDPEFVRMFVDEALLAAVLNHPNIVQIFDLGQIGNVHFIAMELILGHTLRQVQRVLKRQHKVMPPWFAIRVALAVCDALHYAHNKANEGGQLLGIVHRDVTPENIMVSLAGVTKVVDFGIAKASTAATVTRAGRLKGKLSYLAPEQILRAGRSPADRRSDIYALGVVLYEMLTGTRPFKQPNDMALLKAITEEEPPPPHRVCRWVPRRLGEIVLRAMSRDPGGRYDDASSLALELEAFLGSVGAYPTDRHVAEYMHKIFDVQYLAKAPAKTRDSGLWQAWTAANSGADRQSSTTDIVGPDSAGSLEIPIDVSDMAYTEALEEADLESVEPDEPNISGLIASALGELEREPRQAPPGAAETAPPGSEAERAGTGKPGPESSIVLDLSSTPSAVAVEIAPPRPSTAPRSAPEPTPRRAEPSGPSLPGPEGWTGEAPEERSGPAREAREPAAEQKPARVAQDGEAARSPAPHPWDLLTSRIRADLSDSTGADSAEQPAGEPEPEPAPEREEEAARTEAATTHLWDALVERARREKGDDEAASRVPAQVGSFRVESRSPEELAAAAFDEGLALVREGRKREALECWDRAARLEPTNRKYQGNLRILRRAVDGGGDEP